MVGFGCEHLSAVPLGIGKVGSLDKAVLVFCRTKIDIYIYTNVHGYCLDMIAISGVSSVFIACHFSGDIAYWDQVG